MPKKKGYAKGGSGRTISDADRAKIAQRMKRKGGGSAMKKKKGYAKGGATRIF